MKKIRHEMTEILAKAYGVLLLEESDKIMSIPFFLTAANTDFDDPMSIPIQIIRLINKEILFVPIAAPASIF
jgi:hypothetical protein